MDFTNAARQARWRARRAAELERLRRANAALKRELAAAAQARIAELENTGAAEVATHKRKVRARIARGR